MRWESLFADLEAAAEAEERAAFEAEVADAVRAERSSLELADRIRAQHGAPLACHLVNGETESGQVLDAGPDWLLLGPAPGRLIPHAAVGSFTGLTRGAAPARGVVARRLGLSIVLRGLCQDRVPVRVRLLGGADLTGTLDRVTADHADLAVHPDDEPRRPSAVTSVRTLRLGALLSVRPL